MRGARRPPPSRPGPLEEKGRSTKWRGSTKCQIRRRLRTAPPETPQLRPAPPAVPGIPTTLPASVNTGTALIVPSPPNPTPSRQWGREVGRAPPPSAPHCGGGHQLAGGVDGHHQLREARTGELLGAREKGRRPDWYSDCVACVRGKGRAATLATYSYIMGLARARGAAGAERAAAAAAGGDARA